MEPLSRLALESGVAELMEATLPSAGSGLVALWLDESGWRWLSRWQYTSSTEGKCSEQTGHLGAERAVSRRLPPRRRRSALAYLCLRLACCVSMCASRDASSRKTSGQWMHCRSARSDSRGCWLRTCFSSSSVWPKVSSQ